MLPLARNRNFRLVFSAGAVSNLGDGVTAVALPWLAAMLTRDAVLVAVVAAAGRFPWLLFSLPAGVVADRADRRCLIVWADVVRAVLTCGVVLVAMRADPADGQDAATVAVLSALAFLLGSAEVLRDNAAQSLLPAIVRPEDLERANGRMWTAEEVMTRFVGPPLAGVLIGLGIVLPFGLDALSFLAAAGLVWLVALPTAPRPATKGFLAALAEGIDWLRGNAMMLRLALMLACVNFLYAAAFAVFVLYGQEVLGLSAAGYGVLLMAGAAGGMAGGLLGPGWAARLGSRRAILLSLATMGGAYGVLAAFRSPAAAGLALFLEGAAGILWNIVTVSWRQRIIPAPLLGRVNAICRFFGNGAMALGALAGGLAVALAEGLGRDVALHVPFVVAMGGFAAVALWAARAVRFPAER